MSETKFTPPEVQRNEKDKALAELNTQEMRMHILKSARMIKNNISDADAEDVAQRTMLNANQAIQKDQFNYKSTLKTWIHKIVKNLIIGDIRYNNANFRGGFIEDIYGNKEVEDTNQDAEQRLLETEEGIEKELDIQNLKSDIKRLPPRSKEVIELLMEGVKIVEIARRLNINRATVRSIIFRAKKALLTKAYGEDKVKK